MQDLIPRAETARLGTRFVDDRRGTSTVTSAVVFPLFIVIMMAFIYILTLLSIQWQLNEGTREASQHISEMARYWNISGTQMIDPFNPSQTLTNTATGDPLPENFYELEATRLIAGRLRDLRYYSEAVLSQTLAVTVTEPPLAYGKDSPPVIDVGFTERMCSPKADQPDEWREFENVRFLVRSSYRVYWPVVIPYMNSRFITLQSRAIGHVQCPRWLGQVEADVADKSFQFNVEGPHLPSRYLTTPQWPTVTPPVATAEPSPTPSPTPP